MSVNANSIVQQVIQIKKWSNDKCQCQCTKYCTCKKDYGWNPSICTCENGNYLKSIIDESATMCSEIINVTENIPTNMAKCDKYFTKKCHKYCVNKL